MISDEVNVELDIQLVAPACLGFASTVACRPPDGYGRLLREPSNGSAGTSRRAFPSPAGSDLPYRGRVGSIRTGRTVPTWLAAAALALVGCTSEPDTAPTTVGPEQAYTAIVRWEIEQSGVVVDDEGNPKAPVIYLAASSGGTVDVGVQANVVAEIEDAAVIRFADDTRDARDEQLDGEPVKDDGVMIVVDEFESGLPRVDARIMRYRSADDQSAWILEVVATTDGADVVAATEAVDASD